VTSQGSAYGRFQRALKNGRVFQAELAAREMRFVSLADALRLVELYAKREPAKFERAALRWFTRYLEEAKPSLLQAQIALAALGELRGQDRQAAKLLADLAA
jgi:hypothetical protein